MKKSLKQAYREGIQGLILIDSLESPSKRDSKEQKENIPTAQQSKSKGRSSIKTKTQQTIPLNTICPCWKFQLIPTAFEALQRGIAREKERFQNKPFILYSLVRDSDYDSADMDYLELIEGFTDQASAIRQSRTHAGEALSRALAETGYGSLPWRQVYHTWGPVLPVENKKSDVLKRVFEERFKVASRTGYYSMYYSFEVLHVRTLDIIGPELFCFIDAEWAWISFLTGRGETEKDA